MINNDFANIISVMNRNDGFCQGASQQMSNGFYRIFDALEIIYSEIDESNSQGFKVKSLRTTLNRNDGFCQGAPQQCANGAYRIVEILQVIISYLDKEDKYRFKTSSIMQTMNTNDGFCQGAPQQVANGSYRIAEMLEILTEIIAESKSALVKGCISQMNTTNSFCQGAPQQSANGTDAVFYIVQHIVKALDTEDKYSVNLASIATLKNRNNGYCQGADQQSANNLYRTMETIQVLGYIMTDKAQKRIDAYWEEHKEEYDSLIKEKNDCNESIKQIKAEANAINEDEKIKEINKQIYKLNDKKKHCGSDELHKLQKAVDERKAERSQIGLFKFSLRKEAAAKIEEANLAYRNKLQEVNLQKAEIQKEIEALQKEIEKLKAQVDSKRAIVLKKCDSYKMRINDIDSELTKKR